MKLLLGLFLIFLASPFVLWFSEGARSAKDFNQSEIVSADTVQDGYIAVEGTPTDVTDLLCATGIAHDVCLYQATKVEEYTYKEVTQCGDLSESTDIIERVEDRCDSEGCEPCYLVDQSDWETVADRKDFADFTIGVYDIRPSGSANIVGEQTYKVGFDKVDPIDGEQRTTYTYLPNEGTVLVAGQASNGMIRGDVEETLFISDLNYEATAAQLKAEDRATKWAGRIFSLILMMLGFVLVVAQFVDPLTGTMRIVPILGRKMQDATRGVIYAAAALIGAAVWIPLFIVIFLFRNIWVGIIVVVILAGLFIYKEATGKKINVKLPGKK